MNWSLEELLPHRAPMVFLDGVESFDSAARSLTATVSITPAHVLYSPALGGVPNWAAIEFMAQAAAALAGCFDRNAIPRSPRVRVFSSARAGSTCALNRLRWAARTA